MDGTAHPLVVSADCHLDLIHLPADLFTARMSPRWEGRAPHVVERDGARVWVSGDDIVGQVNVSMARGGRRAQSKASAGFAREVQARPSDPRARAEDMDRDGVHAEIVYGLTGLCQTVRRKKGLTDPALVADVYRVYNDFVAEFRVTSPRFCALGCIPNHGPEAAIAELQRCARLGLRGVVFVPWGAAMPLGHPAWEPLWSAAEEAGVVMGFHAFEGGTSQVGRGLTAATEPAAIAADLGAWVVVAPLQHDEIVTSLVLSGICERHPGLRFTLGESGIGWLPYLLERLDHTYKERLDSVLRLPMLPSDYFKRQIFATFQVDRHGVRAMAEIAPDNVMWGSDYPHDDGTWPLSAAAIDAQFAGVDAGIRDKMLWKNACALYGLEPAQELGGAIGRS